jgi:hypothetical protein
MSDAFLDFVRQYHGVTFAEAVEFLEEMLPVSGDCRIQFADDPVIVLWADLSKPAATVMTDLINRRELFLRPCDRLLYLTDGTLLDAPVSDGRTPGWFPCLLTAVPWGDGWRVEVGGDCP